MLRLRKVAPFVPSSRIPVTELSSAIGLSTKEVRLFTRFLGLSEIASADGLTVLDMLLAAGEEALAGEDRANVRYLIHAHTTQHVAPPGLRMVDSLREKLGLTSARSFSMSQQSCVTALYALKVAQALLGAEPAGSTALVVVGEKVLSAPFQHIPETTVQGDAAVASLVALSGPGDSLLGSAYQTHGRFHATRYMSPELFALYRTKYGPFLAAVIRDAVRDAGVSLDDISLVLPHNVNRFSWTIVARELSLPVSRIYLETVPLIGHCFGADPFVNLAAARASGLVRPGSLVILASAGQGGTFGAVVVRIGTGPIPGVGDNEN
jgi:3-oxoacyl-[acyl-carrier-protein] synthase-3